MKVERIVRKFIDLHLCPSVRDEVEFERTIDKSSELGYCSVGIPLQPDTKRHEIQKLKEICGKRGVDFIKRIDLAPKTKRELLQDLRRFRWRFEVVSVFCNSKLVARQAARDRRVDLLLYPADPRRRFFDSAEAKLASKTFASLEINMSSLLLLRGVSRTRLLSCLRSEIEIARKHSVPIIVSSGASNEYLLRHPHDYLALTSLFDLSKPLELRALSTNPKTIIERNREKLSQDYVTSGIKVVRRGKNRSSV